MHHYTFAIAAAFLLATLAGCMSATEYDARTGCATTQRVGLMFGIGTGSRTECKDGTVVEGGHIVQQGTAGTR